MPGLVATCGGRAAEQKYGSTHNPLIWVENGIRTESGRRNGFDVAAVYACMLVSPIGLGPVGFRETSVRKPLATAGCTCLEG